MCCRIFELCCFLLSYSTSESSSLIVFATRRRACSCSCSCRRVVRSWLHTLCKCRSITCMDPFIGCRNLTCPCAQLCPTFHLVRDMHHHMLGQTTWAYKPCATLRLHRVPHDDRDPKPLVVGPGAGPVASLALLSIQHKAQ